VSGDPYNSMELRRVCRQIADRALAKQEAQAEEQRLAEIRQRDIDRFGEAHVLCREAKLARRLARLEQRNAQRAAGVVAS
jgi:hypothetical protein